MTYNWLWKRVYPETMPRIHTEMEFQCKQRTRVCASTMFTILIEFGANDVCARYCPLCNNRTYTHTIDRVPVYTWFRMYGIPARACNII